MKRLHTLVEWKPHNYKLLSGTIREPLLSLVCSFHHILAVKRVSWLLMVFSSSLCFGSSSYFALPASMIFLKVEHLNAQSSEFISLKFSEFSSCSEYNIKLR